MRTCVKFGSMLVCLCFFFQAEDGIRDHCVTGVQTCALPISGGFSNLTFTRHWARSPCRNTKPRSRRRSFGAGTWTRATAYMPPRAVPFVSPSTSRSEEHTSELQSHSDLVCRLQLETKKETRP